MFCSAGHLMHENTMFGKAVLAASGASDLEMEGMKREAMKALIMHEVGHTLGLNVLGALQGAQDKFIA